MLSCPVHYDEIFYAFLECTYYLGCILQKVLGLFHIVPGDRCFQTIATCIASIIDSLGTIESSMYSNSNQAE